MKLEQDTAGFHRIGCERVDRGIAVSYGWRCSGFGAVAFLPHTGGSDLSRHRTRLLLAYEKTVLGD